MKKHKIVSLLKILPISLIAMAIGSWILYFPIKFFSQDFPMDEVQAHFLFLDTFANVAIAAAGIFFILIGIGIVVITANKERLGL